jgi:DedD protein
MAFFKFRKSGDEPSSAPSPAESVEVMRRRAKYRLIGAAVLVLAGVIGFPLVFDKQPRPVAVDMPIDIPDRNKVAPLAIPAASAQQPQPANSTPAEVPAPSAAVAPIAPAPVELAMPAQTPAAKVPNVHSGAADPKPEIKSIDKPAAEPAPKPKAAADDGAKAQAILEGKVASIDKPAIEGRYVVQVGAFADAVRAREVRLKVEQAGLKTYTQVAETKEGRRIRVRVGPYVVKAEADKAAEKIRKLELPASILTL